SNTSATGPDLRLTLLDARRSDSNELAHRIAALPENAARAATAVALLRHWRQIYDDGDRGVYSAVCLVRGWRRSTNASSPQYEAPPRRLHAWPPRSDRARQPRSVRSASGFFTCTRQARGPVVRKSRPGGITLVARGSLDVSQTGNRGLWRH